MPHVTEIAPDVYRICVLYPEINLQFCHFLINDEEPLLFHTGLRRMFSEVREGVAKIIDSARLRWISWSHFESDECGSLNDWLAIAPHAQPVCNMVGSLVSVNDFCGRQARVLSPHDTLATGKHRLRYYPTPHLPHGWDAGVLFDETDSTLLCSDLFTHGGDVEPLTDTSIVDRASQTLAQFEAGPIRQLCSLDSEQCSNSGRSRLTKSEDPRRYACIEFSRKLLSSSARTRGCYEGAT